jgi:hypothetical protein
MTERAILSIQEQDIVTAKDTVTQFDNESDFALNTLCDIKLEQEELYNFLEHAYEEFPIYDLQAYYMGIAHAYHAIPPQHRLREISLEEADLSMFNIRDFIPNRDDNKLDLSWFTNKIRSESPDFEKWINTTVKNQRIITDFQLGAHLTLMPFYVRAETKMLNNKFPIQGSTPGVGS